MKTPSVNWGKASIAAHRTSRWAKTMTKWLITKNCKNGAKWHVVNFVGSANSDLAVSLTCSPYGKTITPKTSESRSVIYSTSF